MNEVIQRFSLETSKIGDQIFSHWFPRMLVAGLDYNDLRRLMIMYEKWEDWPVLWEEIGNQHLNLGKKALEKKHKHKVTAGYSFRRAALYFHYGQFMLFDRPEKKTELYKKCMDVYEEAVRYLPNPGRKIYIPFGDQHIPAFYREVTERNSRMVLMLPGADANKEELSTFEDIFLERGISTLTIDGPGQGEIRSQVPFRKDAYDEAIKTVLDYALGHLGCKNGIAVGGISFGGYLAPRAAACNPIIKACFGVGGPFDLSDWSKMTLLLQTDFTYVFGVNSYSEAQKLCKEIDLSDVIDQLKCPLTIVHGEKDEIIHAHHAERIVKTSNSCEPNLIIIKGGNHVCNNYPYIYRPIIGDWIVDKLS